jgi:hypothetical protein
MDQPPPSAQLFQMMTGFVVSQAIFVAARLGVADAVSGGPRPVADIARELKADPASLYRLLRTLASVGVFAETSPRTFSLTPMGAMLRRDDSSGMHAAALMIDGVCYGPFGQLVHSVKTGRPAFDEVFGSPIFDYFTAHPDVGRIFDAAMTGIHGPETPAMIEAYDFTPFKTIVDVGGGNGSLLFEVLRAAPGASGVVFDLPGVIERTNQAIRAAGLGDRCRAEGGSFFDSVTRGGDAYILRHIIHDWDNERCITILRRCREALAPGGKVLVIESVVPPGNDPHPGKMLDMIMLAVPGGVERTAEEFERLFAAAGLRLTRIVPTKSPVSVVEGVAQA